MAESIPFDRVADRYDSTRPAPDFVATSMARRIRRHLSHADWHLDAGVGTGRFGCAMAAQHPRTIGIDVSSPMLLAARRHGFPTGLVRGDVTCLPFADQTFRSVLVVHLLHLIPNWNTALTELARVTAVDGRLWFGFEQRTRDVTSTVLADLVRTGLAPAHPGAHQEDVSEWLIRHGWEIRFHRPWRWRWKISRDLAQVKAEFRSRTWSNLWGSPDETIETACGLANRWADVGVSTSTTVRMHLLEARRRCSPRTG